MNIFLNIAILIGLGLVVMKFITVKNSYQKIIGFYFIFTAFNILISINLIAKFSLAMDIIFLLFLLELAAILFLLLNQKNN